MLVQSPEARTLTWADGGCLVSGNPVTTDPDPNVTPPSADRIVGPNFNNSRCVYAPGLSTSFGAQLLLLIVGPAGASINMTAWFFDDTLGQWVKCGNTAQLDNSTASGSAVNNKNDAGVFVARGIRWFVQLNTVTGNVTAFGYTFA